MSYLTEAVEKVAAKMEAAKSASAFSQVSKIIDVSDALIKTLAMIATRTDATDERIVQGVSDAGLAIDELQALVCKLTDRIEVLESKDPQTTH